jgi:hypothetical protein
LILGLGNSGIIELTLVKTDENLESAIFFHPVGVVYFDKNRVKFNKRFNKPFLSAFMIRLCPAIGMKGSINRFHSIILHLCPKNKKKLLQRHLQFPRHFFRKPQKPYFEIN